LNDGLAFPFVHLGILIAAAGGLSLELAGEWLLRDLIYRVIIGVLAGVTVGWLLGKILFDWPRENALSKTGSGVVAFAGVLLAYGATEIVEGYGFIAAFVSGYALRRSETHHHFHKRLHDFTESLEHFCREAHSAGPGHQRSMVQFPVFCEVYDRFFNGRSGYRAAYYVSENLGDQFNREVCVVVSNAVRTGPHQSQLIVRKIELSCRDHRIDTDVGSEIVDFHHFVHSLDSDLSRMWICERRSNQSEGFCRVLINDLAKRADHDKSWLDVPRWTQSESGRRALFADKDASWLEIKGGFYDANLQGSLSTVEPSTRSKWLHERGWS
jgi:hypothetical protein